MKGGYLFRGLEIAADKDNDRIFIIIPAFVGDDLYEFPLLCWQDAWVAAFDLQLNNRLEDGSVIFTATPDSELVLEPFRLVSVTEAVEAASCLKIADIRYRVGPEEPLWMAKGKLIHTLFEHLVHNGGEASSRTFDEAFRIALPAFMGALPGSRIVVDETELEDEARVHFENLGSWLARNGKTFSSAQVEVDRMSGRFGLKGRADALFHNGDGRRTLLELKSGKVPVDDHLLQLYSYSMLFAGESDNSQLDGYVIYSSTGRAVKLDTANKEQRRTILTGRNRVLFLKNSYIRESGGLSKHACTRNGRCFVRSSCRRLFCDPAEGQKLFRNSQEREYYNRWFRILSLNVWAEDEDFARVLDRGTLQERLVEGTTLGIGAITLRQDPEFSRAPAWQSNEFRDSSVAQNLDVDRQMPLAGKVYAELSMEESGAEVGPGEEVILHRGDSCSAQAFRAFVHSSRAGQILLSLKIPFSKSARHDVSEKDSPPHLSPEGWFLDKVPFSRGRETARHMLFRFFQNASPQVLRTVVHGGADTAAPPASTTSMIEENTGSVSTIEDSSFSAALQSELNEDQEAAVRAALGSQTYHLIHGPPGTGKTRVLATLIRVCLDRGERILVACPTNVALDRLLIALMNLGVTNFIRIGGRSSASREFLEVLGDRPALLEDFCRLHSGFRDFLRRITETRLVGATAYQTASHPFFLRQRFDRVIVDEAGQLDEPSTLGPLALAPKFVLGGDHFQLPPVVKVRSDEIDPNGGAGLERSLFERLIRDSPQSGISALKMQYRMNSEIQEISSRIFYNGMLFPAPDVENRRLKIELKTTANDQISRIIDPDLPVVFVDVHGPDSGKARPEEAEVACRIVETLIAHGVPAQEMGIITPYRAQQALIRMRLPAGHAGRPLLSVDTVDRFQGGEREVIILSLARSDGVTSFLADRKRLNVSLSRARSKLILLGHGKVLEEHPLFMSILSGLERITIKDGLLNV